MHVFEFKDCNLDSAADIAKKLAGQLSIEDIVCLYGDLGVGKTQFAKLLLKELIVDGGQEVTSPTYNIVHTYKFKNGGEISHFDLYRIRLESELMEIGFEDALYDTLCVIEWPGVADMYLPKDRIDIYFDFAEDEGKRNIKIESVKWLKL